MKWSQSPYSPSLNVSPPSPSLSSKMTGWRWDHIRYHAANPARAAIQVANRTCPVGSRSTAMARCRSTRLRWKHKKRKTKLNNNNNLTTVPHSSMMHTKRSIKTYSFWQHSRDICWCHHPWLRGQASQHLKHPPGWLPVWTVRRRLAQNLRFRLRCVPDVHAAVIDCG